MPAEAQLEEDLSGDHLFEHGELTVNITAIVCWCGAAWIQKKYRRGDHSIWLKAGQQVETTCKRGHLTLLRFIPETVGEES